MGVGAGLYMYDVVVEKFTFAISSPDEFLYTIAMQHSAIQFSASSHACNAVISRDVFFRMQHKKVYKLLNALCNIQYDCCSLIKLSESTTYEPIYRILADVANLRVTPTTAKGVCRKRIDGRAVQNTLPCT